jgi:hypothetical protein
MNKSGAITKMILLTAITLFGLFLMTSPAYAQDNTASNASPAGVGVLLLLMGFGALVLIGGAYSLSGRTPGKDGLRDEDDDDE